MAKIGASRPYYAIYDPNNGAPTYSGGGLMGALVEFNFELESTDNNNFYADNKVKESQRRFTNGTVSVTPDDLSQEVSADMLGVTPTPITGIEGITDEDATELIWDDNQDSPYLGIGLIEKKQVDNQDKWRAIILTKVIFDIPSDAAVTEGEEIEWQTSELIGAILRDDSTTHRWKREATFTTEAQADLYLRARLNIPDTVPGLNGGAAATP